MDPNVVFDCLKVLPNRFALTLAAAARSRALNRGAEPRIDRHAETYSELALREFAAGVFTPGELSALLSGPTTVAALAAPISTSSAATPEAVAAPGLPTRETIH